MHVQAKAVIPSAVEESRGHTEQFTTGFLHFGRNDKMVTPRGRQ